MRIVEILVAVNAACGIAAFLLARGAIRRLKRGLGMNDSDTSRNLDGKEEDI